MSTRKRDHVVASYDKKTGQQNEPHAQCCCDSPENHIERGIAVSTHERDTVYAPPATTVYQYQCPHCGCSFDL